MFRPANVSVSAAAGFTFLWFSGAPVAASTRNDANAICNRRDAVQVLFGQGS